MRHSMKSLRKNGQAILDTEGRRMSDKPTPILKSDAELLASPSVSYWLKDRIREIEERDLVDVLYDSRTLVAVIERRLKP